ncbi:MAG: TonB-dependent siderophore receptor [Alphaproteobacteria bacterium]|nr:TonB-dependent siderophore receptor [Alphaproteobacteria bacterium]
MTRHPLAPSLPEELCAVALGAARPTAGLPPTIGLCLMATACVAAGCSAFAQETGTIMLPGLEVETTSPSDATGPTAGGDSGGAGSEQAAEDGQNRGEASAGAATGTAPGEGKAADANPFADPEAPWKVDRSANSRIRTPLIDTPRSITAIPKEVLEQKNATSVRELARTTPGITLGTGEGGNAFGDVLFIRGFKATNDAFIDGVRDSGSTLRENFMTEQVEILKGPAGTISGRGVTGGAINLVTKKPLDRDFIKPDITIGTDELFRGTVDANKVFSEKFRVRVNAMGQTSDVPGRDNVYDDRWGAAISAEARPIEALTVGLDYYHLSIEQLPDWGVPWDSAAGAPATESLGVARETFYGIPDRDFQDAGQDVGTLRLDYDIGDGFALSNRTRLSQSRNDYVLTAPSSVDTSDPDPRNWTASVSFKSNKQENTVLANTSELTWAGRLFGAKHDAILGLELSREHIDMDRYTGLTSEDYQPPAGQRGCVVNLYNPDPVASGCWSPGDPLSLSGNPTKVEVDTVSAFLGDAIEVYPGVTLTLGARLDHYGITKEGTGNSGAFRYARDDLMVNWNAGLSWKPAPNGTVYAAVATSTNPMGQELDAGGGFYGGLDEAGALLDPERNIAYEAGVKWTFFGGNLLTTAALFRTEKDNARETLGRGADAITAASGAYYVQGVEFGIAGKVFDRLSLHGGLSLMQSEVTSSGEAGNIGEELANIAHHQFNLLARWQVTEDFAIGGQATWRGEIQGGSLAATNGNTLPSFWRFDAMAEYRLTDTAAINLSVNNLTDKTYYDAFYRSGSPFAYVAPGRSAYVKLKLAF